MASVPFTVDDWTRRSCVRTMDYQVPNDRHLHGSREPTVDRTPIPTGHLKQS